MGNKINKIDYSDEERITITERIAETLQHEFNGSLLARIQTNFTTEAHREFDKEIEKRKTKNQALEQIAKNEKKIAEKKEREKAEERREGLLKPLIEECLEKLHTEEYKGKFSEAVKKITIISSSDKYLQQRQTDSELKIEKILQDYDGKVVSTASNEMLKQAHLEQEAGLQLHETKESDYDEYLSERENEIRELYKELSLHDRETIHYNGNIIHAILEEGPVTDFFDHYSDEERESSYLYGHRQTGQHKTKRDVFVKKLVEYEGKIYYLKVTYVEVNSATETNKEDYREISQPREPTKDELKSFGIDPLAQEHEELIRRINPELLLGKSGEGSKK